ncbi:hypothetical protein F5883DRAFT_640595 [Diaporthe sp. PMI_573]|nr:hypothetical protein F5883DRAFT_640595 [Diaporthaceae sp. PMI_573]
MEQGPALHWAAAASSFMKARILLSHGMDVKSLRKGPCDGVGMAKGTALHEAAGAHYAEAKYQRRSPLEWDPDEQARLVKLLLDARVDPQAKYDRGRPGGWVVNGPGFEESMCKKLTKSEGATFNDDEHLEWIVSILRGVGKRHARHV